MKMDRFDVLQLSGYGVWIILAILKFFFEIDPVTSLLVVCLGSGVVGTGLYLRNRHERLEKENGRHV